MRQPHLVLLWRLGVFADLEHRNVVVIILKAEEDTKPLALVGDFHPENVSVEPFRCIQIAHLDHHVSDSLDRHTPPPAKHDHFERLWLPVYCTGRSGEKASPACWAIPFSIG